MGNTYSPPPFSLFTQLPCLWLPTATHHKKKKAPRERVTIVTTFSRATPQSVHLSYMPKPLRSHPNLGVYVLEVFQGEGGGRITAHMSNSWSARQAAWEGARSSTSNRASFIREIRWQKVYVLSLENSSDESRPAVTAGTQRAFTSVCPQTRRSSSQWCARGSLRHSRGKKDKCHSSNICIFKLNKFLSPPRVHMASSSRSLPQQSQRSNLISLITGDPLLIHAICCSVSMQPRCSVYRDGYAVLIVCLSTHCCLTEQKGYL